MGTKFTPGPWTADDRTERFAIFAKSQHTGETFELASVQIDDADDVLGEDGLAANAALIAAAPELLTALRDLLTSNNRRHGAECAAAEDSRGVRHPRADCTCGMDDREDAARAAIMRAEGRP